MSHESNPGADSASKYDADSYRWLDSISAKCQLKTVVEVNDFVLLSGTRTARQVGLLITMPIILSLGAVALCKLPATLEEAVVLNAPTPEPSSRQMGKVIPFHRKDKVCPATTTR